MYNLQFDREAPQTKFYGMYRGIVHDNLDPLQVGRCKISVFGVYPPELEKSGNLPWAIYADPLMGGSADVGGFFVPEIGSLVWVFFEQGDHMQPVYFAGAPSAKDMPDEKTDHAYEDKRGSVVYPKNKVIKTKSGHKIEMDDSNGAAQIRITHKSGTIIVMHDNGDIYEHVVGNVVRVIDGNVTETITGNFQREVTGNEIVNISGSSTKDVSGGIEITSPNVSVEAEVDVTGNTAITGNTDISGSFGATGGSFTHDGKNVGASHTHKDTMPGNGNTGEPN